MMKHSFICLAALISLSSAAYSKEDEAVQPYPAGDVPLSQVSADIAARKTTSIAAIGASIARNSEFIKTPASGHPVGAVQTGQTVASISMYVAVADDPHITVPIGQVNGLQVGLSFVGTAWTEPLLMSLGGADEQASHKRVPLVAYMTAGTVS